MNDPSGFDPAPRPARLNPTKCFAPGASLFGLRAEARIPSVTASLRFRAPLASHAGVLAMSEPP